MADMLTRQKSAWTWGGALATAAMTLPVATAQADGGWIAPVLALPAVLFAERLFTTRSCGLARGFCNVLGRRFGRVLTIIYIVWAAVLGGVQLWGSVRRLGRALEIGWPEWALTAGMVLLTLWIVRGKVSACAQWAMLALNGLLVVLGVIALLALMQVRWDNLLPLWSGGDGLAGAVGISVGLMCVRVYGAFVPGEGKPCAVRYPVPVCGLLSLLLLTVRGGLGAELAARLEDPLLALSRNVGIEGTFRRVESVLAAALLLGDLILLSLLVWAVKLAAKQSWNVRNGEWVAWVVGAGMFVIAWLPAERLQMQRFNQQVVPGINFVLGVIVPLVLMVVERVKGEKRGAHLVP